MATLQMGGVSIYTSRYQNPAMADPHLHKVGITTGLPKFKLGYTFEHAPELAPGWAIMKLPRDEFEVAFRKQVMDRRGEAGVRRRLELWCGMAKAQGKRAVVLLCYEDLRKEGEWCHRQMVARWLEEHFGAPVEEYPDRSAPKGPRPTKAAEPAKPGDVPQVRPGKKVEVHLKGGRTRLFVADKKGRVFEQVGLFA